MFRRRMLGEEFPLEGHAIKCTKKKKGTIAAVTCS